MTESLRRPGVAPQAITAAEILGSSILLTDFRLAGGTALAWYLGHRISEDLDFFTFVPGILHRHSSFAGALAEIAEPASSRIADDTIHTVVARCRVSFFGVEGTWFDVPCRVGEGLDLASVREIAAMKLVAVMTRCAKKDFYDLVAIANSGISMMEMVNCGRRMYEGFDEALPHLRRSLVFFEEAEDDPDPASIAPRKWSDVKREIERLARELR